MAIVKDFARETAAAAAKELHRKGCSADGQYLMDALFAEADAYDTWGVHATHERMTELLQAEWRKVRGRSLGGFVSASMRRNPLAAKGVQ